MCDVWGWGRLLLLNFLLHLVSNLLACILQNKTWFTHTVSVTETKLSPIHLFLQTILLKWGYLKSTQAVWVYCKAVLMVPLLMPFLFGELRMQLLYHGLKRGANVALCPLFRPHLFLSLWFGETESTPHIEALFTQSPQQRTEFTRNNSEQC